MRQYKSSVAVIGSGAAGMMAALAAADFGPVILVTDRKLGRSNSLMAQGGLQVPLDEPDERSAMIDDMVASSRNRASVVRIRTFVSNIAAAIDVLSKIGVDFDRDEDGRLIRRLAGGLSRPRIISSADQIGPKVMTALRKALIDRSIEILEFCRVDNLCVLDGTDAGKWAVDFEFENSETGIEEYPGGRGRIVADAVVCATGGRTFAHAQTIGEPTTNPANSNERIYEVLKNLGLTELGKNLFQYQPFGIVQPVQARGRCVPETITNFNIDIVDRGGERVCNVRDDRLAMVSSMKEAHLNGRSFEFGDRYWAFAMRIPPVDREAIKTTFPKLRNILAGEEDVIYVQPILHYFLGGFPVGTTGETELPGLHLAGEITTGLHGVNRLMGTGLLDSLVGGMVAGRHAGKIAKDRQTFNAD